MKIEFLVITTVLFVSSARYSWQDPSQETAVSSSQAWQDEYQIDEYRGDKVEEAGEDGPQRRPRGKRRRRMRKRQRVQPVEDVDRASDADLNQEGVYERPFSDDEGVTPLTDIPRRRPGKRRRRPHRRYQDEDGAPLKPLRRRRKGGRKKIRPENHEEPPQTDTPQEEQHYEEQYEPEVTTQMIRTTPSPILNIIQKDEPKPTIIIPKVIPSAIVPKVVPTVIIHKAVPTLTIPKPTDTTFKKEESQDIKVASNAVKTENEDTGKSFGSKIFDRKKLFSSPRRALPVTSAVIRKLGPNIKGNISEILNTKSETKEKFEPKIVDKTIIKSNSLLDSTTNVPEAIKPEKHVHSENKIQKLQDNDSHEIEDEEPNYPKIIPRPIYYRSKKPTVETTTYTTTETIETTSEKQEPPSSQRPNITEIEFEQTEPGVSMAQTENEEQPKNNTMTEKEFEQILENLGVANFNLTHFDDYIVDLLQTKSGKEHLSKILESRNMTVTQLLEHRERGSSKFHLFEMFPQKKSTEKPTQPTTTTSSTTDKTDIISQDEQQIQFPNQDVLGSYPKFMAEEISRHGQKDENKIDQQTEGSVNKESREPRVFDSLPEFTTLSISSTTKEDKHPTWRVIPNPKLRPVSVRGNYHEIPISHVLNRPLENNVNDIYIVDEREALIHHKKYGVDNLEPIRTKDTFGSFKKIPVGVKSAIIISGIILAVATFGFLSLLISCRVRQKRSIRRAKQDMMCEHLQNDDFMTSQQSLSPVLTKHQQAYAHTQQHHSHPHNRHYYLWRTIRRTFRYD